MSIVSITRGTKSGGLELANCLSKRLGYKMLSREVIFESAKKYNIPEDFLSEKLDKAPTLWQKFTNEYERYIIFIRCSLLNDIKEDNIIYHGYAGQLLLKDLPHVLKLRIEAPLDYRVDAVVAEHGFKHEEAVDFIKKVDDSRKRWVKMVYNEDWCNPSLYDIWINLQNISINNICEMIETAIEHRDFKSSKESIDRLNNISLACEVKAALSSDDKIWNSSQKVSVYAHEDVVTLRGNVKDKELMDLIVDTTLKVKGVNDCKPEISLLSDSI